MLTIRLIRRLSVNKMRVAFVSVLREGFFFDLVREVLLISSKHFLPRRASKSRDLASASAVVSEDATLRARWDIVHAQKDHFPPWTLSAFIRDVCLSGIINL